MNSKPKSPEEIDKKENIIHFVLTGWKTLHNLDHSRYIKIPYSSHSSGREL